MGCGQPESGQFILDAVEGHHADDLLLQGIGVEEDVELGVVDGTAYLHEHLLEGGLLMVDGPDLLDLLLLLLHQAGNSLFDPEVLHQHLHQATVSGEFALHPEHELQHGDLLLEQADKFFLPPPDGRSTFLDEVMLVENA